MSIVHLLIIVVPSFAAGLIFGRSHLTGAYWGIAAEALGLTHGGPTNLLGWSTQRLKPNHDRCVARTRSSRWGFGLWGPAFGQEPTLAVQSNGGSKL